MVAINDGTEACPRRLLPQQGQDEWLDRDGKRTCGYCGSLHPDDAIARLSAGECATPTDKNYKLYVGRVDKVYFQHFHEVHKNHFIQLANRPVAEGGMNVEYPGYFYTLPFFMSYTEAKTHEL